MIQMDETGLALCVVVAALCFLAGAEWALWKMRRAVREYLKKDTQP